MSLAISPRARWSKRRNPFAADELKYFRFRLARLLHKTEAELCRQLGSTLELADWIGFFAYDTLRDKQRANMRKLERRMKKRHRRGR